MRSGMGRGRSGSASRTSAVACGWLSTIIARPDLPGGGRTLTMSRGEGWRWWTGWRDCMAAGGGTISDWAGRGKTVYVVIRLADGAASARW